MRIALTILALPAMIAAQDIAPKDSERDPVLSALLEAATSADPAPVQPELSDNASLDASSPTLVTGTPPIHIDSEPAQGVRVEVEAGSSTASVDPSKIKLVAPFPAKPISAPPRGWKLVQPDDVPHVSKEVQLSGGTAVTLSIRPHVLIPEADGDQVFGLSEPGYRPEDQYAQKETIGAILADSIMSLDSQSERLDEAARRLDELLTSLPSPASEPTPTDQP